MASAPQEDPSEYIYISKHHYDRKKKVEADSTNFVNILTHPGPIGAIIIYLFDAIVEFFARIFIYLFTFVSTGFDYIVAYTFGSFNGLFPTMNKHGRIVGYKFLRYIVNILLPPVGVYLAKGLYGWFNVFVCFILTYMHYIAGIIYCFVITASNRYADLYEKTEIARIEKENEIYKKPGTGDLYAFIAGILIIAVIIAIIMIAIRYV
jgi:uncharacterized membrane protein YqaE (UPF0057 family)